MSSNLKKLQTEQDWLMNIYKRIEIDIAKYKNELKDMNESSNSRTVFPEDLSTELEKLWFSNRSLTVANIELKIFNDKLHDENQANSDIINEIRIKEKKIQSLKLDIGQVQSEIELANVKYHKVIDLLNEKCLELEKYQANNCIPGNTRNSFNFREESIVRQGPVFDRGHGSSKWLGLGFSYYSSKAGVTEVQKGNTGLKGQVIPQMKALAE